jgi:hypothetical protein
MIRRVGVGKVRTGVTPETQAAWEDTARAIPENVPSVLRSSVGHDLNPRTDWDIMWSLEFDTSEGVKTYQESSYHLGKLIGAFMQGDSGHLMEKVDLIYFEPIHTVANPVPIRNGVRRALIFQIVDGVPKEKVEELEAKLAAFQSEVPAIKNLIVGKASGHDQPSPWTHIMEIEFDDLDGLEAYNKHPYHLDVVGPFFRPDSPACIVSGYIAAWHHSPASFIAPA